jgi:hypothetical protein
MPRSYEEIRQDIIESETMGEAVIWHRASLYREALACGLEPKQVATDVGRGAAYVRDLVRTLRAFPEPEQRVPLLTFTHHKYAAATDNPGAWIAQAEAGAWSTRDMQAALRAANATDPFAERQAQGERALQRLRRWWEDAAPEERQAFFPAIQRWYVTALTTQTRPEGSHG